MPPIKQYTRSTDDPRLGPSSRRKQLKNVGLRERTEKSEDWSAEVIKAERCTSLEYKSNQWTKVFEYSHIDKHARCYLCGSGGLYDLKLTLVTAIVSTESEQTVETFSFPAPDAKISLRLYDATALVEIFTDSNKIRGQAAVGDCWAISLRGHNDYEKGRAVKMLRRLEYLAREMPDNWFSYRNFFTVPGHTTGTLVPPPIAVGQYTHEMAGGSSLKFSGNFVRAGILEALGHRNYRPRLGESRMETRKMAREADAYKFSTVLPALRPPRKGERKSARLENLEARRAKRAESPEAASSASGTVRLLFPWVVIPAKTGVQPAEQSVGLPTAATDEPSAQSMTVAANSAQDSVAAANQSSEPDSETSTTEHPIKGILDDRSDSEGNPEYLVDWEDGSTPWWLPEDDVSAEALSVYQQAKDEAKPSKRKAKRGPGRPPKKSKK